jgi:hypothetical protein
MSLMGIGDWGLGIGVLGQCPIPQTPTPNGIFRILIYLKEKIIKDFNKFIS